MGVDVKSSDYKIKLSKAIKSASRAAVNQTLNAVRSRAIRRLKPTTNEQKEQFRKRSRVVKAKGGRLFGSLHMGFEKFGLPVSIFKPVQKKIQTSKGPRIATIISIGERSVQLPSVFMAFAKRNNSYLPFSRTTKSKYPIQFARIPRLFSNMLVERKIESIVNQDAPKIFESRYKKLMSNRRGKITGPSGEV